MNEAETRACFDDGIGGGKPYLDIKTNMGHETTQPSVRFYARWIPDPQISGGYKPVNKW